MKKIYLSPYCVFLIAINCFAAVLLADIAAYGRETYDHILGGWLVAPGLTWLVVKFPGWFWLFGALACLIATGLFVRKVPASVLMHGLLIIAIVDVLLLFFFACGIGLYFVPPLEKIGLDR